MHFAEPDGETVQNWVEWSGTTLVLCGHIHENRRRKIGQDCVVACADSIDYKYVDGRTGRSYNMVSLYKNGKVAIKEIPVDEDW